VHRKYIPIYIQQDATLHRLFIFGNCSTYFGWYLHPSSGEHTPVSTASGICQTVAVAVWQIPDVLNTVVCALDDGWRYHPKHVEQFPDINKRRKVVSCWIYIGINLSGLSQKSCSLFLSKFFHIIWRIAEWRSMPRIQSGVQHFKHRVFIKTFIFVGTNASRKSKVFSTQ
jgi:hypothetical protein